MRARVWLGNAVFLSVLLFILAASVGCGCATLVTVLRVRLSEKLCQVGGSQQAFFAHHGRYARTLAELRYPADSSFEVKFDTSLDSAVQLRGSSVEMPGLSCVLEVTPGKRFLEPKCSYQS